MLLNRAQVEAAVLLFGIKEQREIARVLKVWVGQPHGFVPVDVNGLLPLIDGEDQLPHILIEQPQHPSDGHGTLRR